MPTANLNKITEFLTLTDYIIIIVSIIALLYILMIMFPSLRQLCGCVETMENTREKPLPKTMPDWAIILIMILVCFGAMNTTVNCSKKKETMNSSDEIYYLSNNKYRMLNDS